MTHLLSSRSTRFALTAVLVAVGALPTTASADELGQIIDPDQQQGTGHVVLDAGHADFGPTFGTGSWALQIHDDTSTPRYWRDPDEVVLRVTDAAILTVPDDEAFAFLGLTAGAPVHVIPQVEQPGVVWLGWNTQEPHVLDTLTLGATLRIHAIEGPGEVVAYLQGGNFGEPQPLWSTNEPFPQDAWIELNTHTHANWVFSQPGVYLIDTEFTGDLVTGESMSARGTLRLAVGDATDPAEAFAASLTPTADSVPDEAGTEPSLPDDPAPGGGLWYFVLGGAVILVIAVGVAAGVSARARRRARREAGGRS